MVPTQQVAVIRSPVESKPVVIQPPTCKLPDGEHVVREVFELLQAPEPTLMPSTPPTLLQVIRSPTTNRSRCATRAAAMSTRTSDLTPANLHTAPEDSDSDDEHALQIAVNEPTPPPPCTQASPSLPVACTERKPCKPAELKLLATQLDDGYCSATASSLGSADDVKKALPFASFEECNENKDSHENNGMLFIV